MEISEKQAYLYAKDLENKGFITRKRQKDRRKKIELTEKGKDLLYQKILVVFSKAEQKLVLKIIKSEYLEKEEIAIEILLNSFIKNVIPEIKLTIEHYIQNKLTQEEGDHIICKEIHKSICKLLYKISENFTQKMNDK